MSSGSELTSLPRSSAGLAAMLRDPEQYPHLLRSLLDSAGNALLITEPDDTIVAVNSAFGEFFAVPGESLIGSPMARALHVIDSSSAVPGSVHRSVQRIIEDPQLARSTLHYDDMRALAFELTHGSRIVTVYRGPIRDRAGGLLGRIWAFSDVTDVVRANEQLRTREAEHRAAREELERVNSELRHAQAKLVQSEKMASLGMLVAGIAHELNTPIGAVNSMHDTLVRALDKLHVVLETECGAEVKENAQLARVLKFVDDANRVIADGAGRVTTIVRRLKSFARLETAELTEADVNEGIEDTLVLVHHQMKHRIAVHREYEELPRIACYPGRLNQVFLNLLMNAQQAIEGEGEITIRTWSEDGYVHVAIRDTGCGIPAENLSRIFDPGFTTKGVGVGTGLGLSICYQIVEEHAGELKVESEVGKGSTFTLSIPTDLTERPRVPFAPGCCRG